MSERDKREYEAIKADPVKYAAYLEKKRLARLHRQTNRSYETERKRKWRAANREKDKQLHAANYAVEKALAKGNIQRPTACERCMKPVPVEAHHFMGYAPELRLVIIWLCQTCHSAAHATNHKR